MDAQLKRGVLELCLLADVAKQEQYGYDIIKRLRQSFPDVEESSFYAILRRLYRDGTLEQFPGKISGGPPRKYYRVTPQGMHKLGEQIAAWRTLSTIVDQYLKSD
jgi:PadR family transcriptional regulator PadR